MASSARRMAELLRLRSNGVGGGAALVAAASTASGGRGRRLFIADGLEFSFIAALTKDDHYTLFREEDWPAWVTFTAVFFVLMAVDHVLMRRNPRALTIRSAFAYTALWIACACGFCYWIYKYYGSAGAYTWMSGYMLEWMLSFDNLFVFHMIFTVYATPDHLKHRLLYLGILGAIILRLVFLFIGSYVMHAMFFMRIVFGVFLVYTGFKTVATDDEDNDPSQQLIVKWLHRNVAFVSAYDQGGAFFVRVPVDSAGNPVIRAQGETHGRASPLIESDPIVAAERGAVGTRYGSVDFRAEAQMRTCTKQWRATMSFLVLCCIETSDIAFAVDSMSAIVAQVNDLFLAYTATVFAMLGLRATFFIVDELVRLFSLLKYGVGTVLVFIGVKLFLSHVIDIDPGIVCIILLSAIGLSMVASVVHDTHWAKLKGSG